MCPAKRVPEPEEYLTPSFNISAETVAIIKQILDRNDIYYQSKMLKADLIRLFEERRPIMQIKHQADGGGIKMGEDQGPTVTSIRNNELLCQATLALNGSQCGNPAHAGHLTCGIKAHRAQEPQLSKAPVQSATMTGLSPESLTRGSSHTVETTAGETHRLKILLKAATAENDRLKVLYNTTAAENARLSQLVSNITNENLGTKSTLVAYRSKVDRMVAVFEEIFGENEIS